MVAALRIFMIPGTCWSTMLSTKMGTLFLYDIQRIETWSSKDSFRICLRVIWDCFGDHSGVVWGSFGNRSGTV